MRARTGDKPLAFLPGEIETGFPIVRQAVCGTEESRRLLHLSVSPSQIP